MFIIENLQKKVMTIKSLIIPLFRVNSCVHFEAYFSDLFYFSLSSSLGGKTMHPLFTMLLAHINLNSFFSINGKN